MSEIIVNIIIIVQFIFAFLALVKLQDELNLDSYQADKHVNQAPLYKTVPVLAPSDLCARVYSANVVALVRMLVRVSLKDFADVEDFEGNEPNTEVY